MHALRSLPQPPAHVVQSVDSLFKRRRDGDTTADDLKKHAHRSGVLTDLQDPEKVRTLAALMVNTGVPHRAHRVLLLAHSFGCQLKQSAYEGVAYQLAQINQWAAMPSLVDLGRRQTGRTTARLLNWRARALVEISHYGLLDRVLEDFEVENIPPNRRTFHVLVSGHLRNRDIAKVKECLDWMEDAGFPMDASTHALLVSNYRSLGPDPAIQQQALGSLQEMGSRNATIVLNSLIQLSLDTHDVQSALKYLKHFDEPSAKRVAPPKDGTPPVDGSPSSAPASTLPGTGKPVLTPDIATFTMLTNYAARTLNLSMALQMLERMKSYAVHPDDIYVTSLIRVHCAVNDVKGALRITAQMCKHSPLAIQLLLRLGLDTADIGGPDLFTSSGASLTNRSLNALLKGVLKQQGLKGMKTMYRLMKVIGLKPNDETTEVVMSYLATTENARPGELVPALRCLPSTSRPTLRQVHIILRSLLGREQALATPRGWAATAVSARTTTEEQPNSHVASSEDTPAITLARLAESIIAGRSSYRALVRPLIASLSSRRVEIDRATIHLALRHDALVARNMERAKTTLQWMLRRGMHPNEYHFAATMEGYALSGDMHAAEKVLGVARAAGFGRDPVMYTILIHGWARKGQSTDAARAFQRMLGDGVQADVGAVDALASAFYAVRSYSSARRVLLQFWERFGPFPPELQDADLLTLSAAFRALATQPVYSISKQARRMLRWKVKRIHQIRQQRRRKVKQGVSQRGRHVMHSTPYNKQSKLH